MAKYRFKLLEGQHIEADRTKPKLDADGKPTGRFESKTYTKGAVIDTDTDLAAKLGANKFELVGSEGDAARIAQLERELAELRAHRGATTPGDTAIETPAVAPGGQVSSGFPISSGGGQQRAMTPDEIANPRHGAAPAAVVEEEPERYRRTALQEETDNLPLEQAGNGNGDLDSMSKDELKDYARERGINLHGASTKADIVEAIRAAR